MRFDLKYWRGYNMSHVKNLSEMLERMLEASGKPI